ncbi:MAG: hypothetical protein LIO68_04255 [Rikenellaceae bacterium]|nr:hypothetical protein [Rikenellaceae bacterium]
MKKVIILTTVLLLSLNSWGQVPQFKYRPLTEFKTDTLNFLSAIVRQNDYFDQKPLETLFEILDKEMPIISVTYDGTPTVQYIEFILDHRKQYKLFDQIHLSTCYLDRAYSESDFKELLGADPNIIVPFTPALRKKLGQIKFLAKPGFMIFSLDKIPDPSTLPQKSIQPFEEVE